MAVADALLDFLNPVTLFEKIAAREIPARIVHEDADVIAFHDIDPKAPVHVLIVPKRGIPRLGGATHADAELLVNLLLVAPQVAKQMGVQDSGYRLIINHGPDAGESVPHLHVHLLAGRALAWPPG